MKTKRACKPCAIPLMRTYTDNERVHHIHTNVQPAFFSLPYFASQAVYFVFFSSSSLLIIPLIHTIYIYGINYTNKMASIFLCLFYSCQLFLFTNEFAKFIKNCDYRSRCIFEPIFFCFIRYEKSGTKRWTEHLKRHEIK